MEQKLYILVLIILFLVNVYGYNYRKFKHFEHVLGDRIALMNPAAVRANRYCFVPMVPEEGFGVK